MLPKFCWGVITSTRVQSSIGSKHVVWRKNSSISVSCLVVLRHCRSSVAGKNSLMVEHSLDNTEVEGLFNPSFNSWHCCLVVTSGQHYSNLKVSNFWRIKCVVVGIWTCRRGFVWWEISAGSRPKPKASNQIKNFPLKKGLISLSKRPKIL